MSFYTYIYIISIAISLAWWVDVWRRQKDISWAFFFLFVLFTSAWFIFYYIYFSWSYDQYILLYISRIDFALGICAVYSFLFFIGFFWKAIKRHAMKKLVAIGIFFLIIILFYTFTRYIISDLSFDVIRGVYREIFGSIFFLHIVFHSIFLVLLIPVSYISLARQESLQRARLKAILISSSILLIFLLFLQLLLPYFGIWIFEKEIIFLFAVFVVSIPLIIRRYYFSGFGYGVGKILTYIGAYIWSILGVSALDIWLTRYYRPDSGYWSDDRQNLIILIFLWIITFLFLAKIGKNILNKEASVHSLHISIRKIKREISQYTDFDAMNIFIKKRMAEIFWSYTASIEILGQWDTTESYTHIGNFFVENPDEQVYINDIVFLERFKNQNPDTYRLLSKDRSYFLIFPLYTMSGIFIWLFYIGRKRFGDFYTDEEIDILKDLSVFLETHLKYIRTYEKMEDLSNTLDRRVDEKTMEYNHLINRQKEFIALISHEIRSPLSSLLFQADALISDIQDKKKKIPREKLLQECTLFHSQLVRTSSLITKIFAVEYHDTQQVSLFRERIHFAVYLSHELDLFAAVHPDVDLITEIEDIWFIDIDRIQIQQVLSNLLENALKFRWDIPLQIVVFLKKIDDKLYLSIEDNGTGFGDIDPNMIFDKYTTGSNKNIWLGMWLYLCKKIITLHDGSITASISKKHKWACFTIILRVPPIWTFWL